MQKAGKYQIFIRLYEGALIPHAFIAKTPTGRGQEINWRVD